MVDIEAILTFSCLLDFNLSLPAICKYSGNYYDFEGVSDALVHRRAQIQVLSCHGIEFKVIYTKLIVKFF